MKKVILTVLLPLLFLTGCKEHTLSLQGYIIRDITAMCENNGGVNRAIFNFNKSLVYVRCFDGELYEYSVY